MLRSILVGLDGTPDGQSALELGLRWAKEFDARLVGIAVADEPGILLSESVLVAQDPRSTIGGKAVLQARRQAGQRVREFAARCDREGVRCRILSESGTPYVEILEEAQRCDLILLGRRAHFEQGWSAQPDRTLERIMRGCPRPVVVVPSRPALGEAILVAYDGSAQASRTLYAFAEAGLAHATTVHLLGIAMDVREAAPRVSVAVEFLQSHGVEASGHSWATNQPVGDVILEGVRDLDAGLLVMGAFGHHTMRELFLGSVTRSLLADSPVPIFFFH